MKKPLVSFIVTTLNEELYIEDCLKSIRNQNYQKKEIIVTDSNSTDKTVEIAKKYADKIIVKKSIIPVGRNLGAKHANGDIYGFIDADIMLYPDWTDSIIPHFEDSKVVAVYGDLFPREKDLTSKIMYWWGDVDSLLLRILKIPALTTKFGTAAAIRREAFEKVGGYTNLFTSCDDTDLSARLRKVGKIEFERMARGTVSMRRFKKYGYLKTCYFWLKDYINYTFGRKIPLHEYPPSK
jgi:glycosyltransferase involved in cell wall biosynthesis